MLIYLDYYFRFKITFELSTEQPITVWHKNSLSVMTKQAVNIIPYQLQFSLS